MRQNGNKATRPCRCGHLADPALACSRASWCAFDYQARISGPLFDRIDLRVDVPAMSAADLTLPPPAERFRAAPIDEEAWGRPVLAQPAAIKVVADFAKSIGAVKYFDAGDVQANGFQIVEDDRSGESFTEAGASYMGFSLSALLASALADEPRYAIAFTGDGSFMMNPQILVDGVEHGVKGMIVIFDNRRMAAISGLQKAQYANEFRTNDGVVVDYVRLAGAVGGVKAIPGGTTADALGAALARAHAHAGLSVVHVPVYCGDDPLGGLGAYGSWNVGNWCDDVQSRYLEQKI